MTMFPEIDQALVGAARSQMGLGVMVRMRRSPRKGAIVVFAALAVTSSAMAAATGVVDIPTSKEGAMTPTEAVPAVQQDITSNFALFREQAASPLPAHVAAQVGSSGRFGRNAALARRIDTVAGAGWVIPGDRFLCIAVPTLTGGFATSCVATAVAVAHGLGIRLDAADGHAIDTLVVPDGARAQVSTPTGARTLTPGPDGVVSQRAARGTSGPRITR